MSLFDSKTLVSYIVSNNQLRCIVVDQVLFLRQRNTFCHFTSLDFRIIPGGFRCLPAENLNPLSYPGKFLKS